MKSESVFVYGKGRPKYLLLAATLVILGVIIYLAEYSLSRFGWDDSILGIVFFTIWLAVPVIGLQGMLDVRVSQHHIGKCFVRMPLGSIRWSAVVHAMQSDVFHGAYGKVVRVYHLRTREGSFLPSLMFLETIGDVESLLQTVNSMLLSHGIPVWHKDDAGRSLVAAFTMREPPEQAIAP